jgi:hypothetical protein
MSQEQQQRGYSLSEVVAPVVVSLETAPPGTCLKIQHQTGKKKPDAQDVSELAGC